jgi:CspA family cold shock protein
MSSDSSVTTSSTVERLIGRVKWFNNKAGYGFITVTDGSQSGSDVFVHHSAVGVSNEQYRYLVQGEYVEFSMSTLENSTHKFQASNVTGIKGGKLMCETRNEYRVARSVHNSSSSTSSQAESSQVRPPRQRRAPASRNTRPQSDGPSEGDGQSWTLAKRSNGGDEQRPRKVAPRGRPPRSRPNDRSG